jgi:hypothetical protein
MQFSFHTILIPRVLSTMKMGGLRCSFKGTNVKSTTSSRSRQTQKERVLESLMRLGFFWVARETLIFFDTL